MTKESPRTKALGIIDEYELRVRTLCRAAVAAIVLIALATAAAPASTLRVLVLPFVAQPVGMSDEILASPAERSALRSALVETLRHSGVDALTVDRSCPTDDGTAADGACYERLAKEYHARAILTANVVRYMALLWSVNIGILDARRDDSRLLRSEYKGDFDALIHAMPDIASTIKGSLR